jgi:hypothetical protein
MSIGNGNKLRGGISTSEKLECIKPVAMGNMEKVGMLVGQQDQHCLIIVHFMPIQKGHKFSIIQLVKTRHRGPITCNKTTTEDRNILLKWEGES